MEYSEYLDKLMLKTNEKWFKFYVKTPLIISIIIGLFFFIWGFVDATNFQDIIIREINGKDVKIVRYGFLKAESRIGAELIWWAMGVVLSVSNYFILKILVSPKILSVLYLRKIKQDLDKIVFGEQDKEKVRIVGVDEWVCPHCGEVNSKDKKKCTNCFVVKA